MQKGVSASTSGVVLIVLVVGVGWVGREVEGWGWIRGEGPLLIETSDVTNRSVEAS